MFFKKEKRKEIENEGDHRIPVHDPHCDFLHHHSSKAKAIFNKIMDQSLLNCDKTVRPLKVDPVRYCVKLWGN